MTSVWQCLGCGLRDIAHAFERCPSCWKDKPIMPKTSATSGSTNADDLASMVAAEPVPAEETAPVEVATDVPAAPEVTENAPEVPVVETTEPAASVAPEPASALVSDAPAAPVDAPKDAPIDPQPATDSAPAASLFTPAVPARAPGLAGDLLGDTPPPQSKSGSKSV